MPICWTVAFGAANERAWLFFFLIGELRVFAAEWRFLYLLKHFLSIWGVSRINSVRPKFGGTLITAMCGVEFSRYIRIQAVPLYFLLLFFLSLETTIFISMQTRRNIKKPINKRTIGTACKTTKIGVQKEFLHSPPLFSSKAVKARTT